jgi:hypothetical protein
VFGETVALQPLAWTIVNVWSPIVTVPVRSAPVFGDTASCTVPLPDPVWPTEIPIHGALLRADHWQLAAAVTAIVKAPPVLGLL